MKTFKNLQGKVIPDVVSYIKEYLKEHKNDEILIGCDSQTSARKTAYVTVVALYTPGKGGHVIFSKENTPIEKDLAKKLITETWKSIEIAEYLRENGIPKAKFIDIDLNPDPRYDSNKTLRQAIGLVEGMGYKARWKHNGAMIQATADHVVRH